MMRYTWRDDWRLERRDGPPGFEPDPDPDYVEDEEEPSEAELEALDKRIDEMFRRWIAWLAGRQTQEEARTDDVAGGS